MSFKQFWIPPFRDQILFFERRDIGITFNTKHCSFFTEIPRIDSHGFFRFLKYLEYLEKLNAEIRYKDSLLQEKDEEAYNEGYSEGYSAGYDEGHSAGDF